MRAKGINKKPKHKILLLIDIVIALNKRICIWTDATYVQDLPPFPNET